MKEITYDQLQYLYAAIASTNTGHPCLWTIHPSTVARLQEIEQRHKALKAHNVKGYRKRKKKNK